MTEEHTWQTVTVTNLLNHLWMFQQCCPHSSFCGISFRTTHVNINSSNIILPAVVENDSNQKENFITTFFVLKVYKKVVNKPTISFTFFIKFLYIPNNTTTVSQVTNIVLAKLTILDFHNEKIKG